MSETTRREFLAGAGTAALAASTYAAIPGANERIGVGLIGCGGMMRSHFRTLAPRKDVEIVHLCEVDRNRLGDFAAESAKEFKRDVRTCKDMRELLADKAVDAVFISTPDHWHAPASLLALERDKHVYVEKPCSHNIREGRLMIEAARRSKKVLQVGTQTRSSAHAKEAIDIINSGLIGEVLVVKVWNSQLRRSIGKQKPTEPPATLDYDLWLGPAPYRPYQTNLLHSIWRWWFDFGTGDMGNDGVHDIDVARWGLGVNTHPVKIAALGGKFFFDDDQQFPDTQYVVFEYAPDEKTGRTKQLIFEQRIWSPYHQEGYENGDTFYGTKGMLIFGKEAGGRVILAGNKPGPTMSGRPDLRAHHDNFFDCVRSGKTPNGDIGINHFSTSLCHLGNIATRLGRTLHFDPKAERFINDDEANALVSRKYRDHWATPKGV